MGSFNKLTPAQAERLALLAEECGELVQSIGKVLRHGYASTHPRGGQDNRANVEDECGDVMAAMNLLIEACDLSTANIDQAMIDKRERVGKFLHHAKVKP